MDLSIDFAMALFRRRWRPLLVAMGALFILAPYPIFEPLVRSLEQASIAFAADRPGAAAQALARALAMEPNMPEIRRLATEAALASDDPDLALELLTPPTGTDELDAPCLRVDAEFLRAAPIEAARMTRTIPERCQPDPDRLSDLAQEAMTAGNLEVAEDLQRTALRARPDDPRALEDLAIVIALRDPREALPLLRQVVEISAGRMALSGDLLRAIEDASVEASLPYDFAQVGQTMARHGRWGEAVTAFDRALALDPGYTEARAYRGLARSRSGKGGLRDLEDAHEQAPRAALPASLLAVYWMEAGEPERALEYSSQAVAREPFNPAYQAQLGATLAALGDMQRAREAYQRAAEGAADDPRFWTLLAEFSLHHELDIAGLAIPAARRAYVLDPDARTADNLGRAHLLLGNLEVAGRLLDRALAEDPARPATLYHRGLLALELSRQAEALEWLRQARQGDPEGAIGELAERTISRLTR